MNAKNRTVKIQRELERRILYGLACEWDVALWVLGRGYDQYMKKPLFRLGDMKRQLGHWNPRKREICLNREFILNHPWDSVREVLHHEMAHQFAHEALNAGNETPHGPAFQRACELLRANSKASGSYETLHERIQHTSPEDEDKILIRVKKLMALAQSQNRHEAEAAMLKAHELIARYNIDLMAHKEKRDFITAFVGVPALRRFREEYMLASLLQDFYFVQGIWVPAYVMERGKMGRVLEISGTARNVRLASYVHDFVRHFIDMQWRTYNKAKGLNRYRKTDFAIGILDGFRSKLETSDNGTKENTGTRELVKIEDPQLRQYMRYRYPHTSRVRRGTLSQDANVLSDGIQIGKKLVIAQGVTETGKRGKYLTENGG